MKLDLSKYKNKIKFPARTFEWVVYGGGELKFVARSYKEFNNYTGDKKLSEKIETNKDAYLILCKEYNEEEARVKELLKSDLEEYYGVSKHPNKDLLFSIACYDNEADVTYIVDDYAKYVKLLK